ncbi:MAG: hypothetical protein ACLFSQ_03425 [Candidatus Zixiibacteriota bacterium]
MSSNPNKSIEKYIQQGSLILHADEKARKNGDNWTLVTTIRGVLHTRLGQLRTKTIKLEELNNDLAKKIDEKNKLLEKMRSDVKELAVYVENAFFFDDADIMAALLLDKKLPDDEKGFYRRIDNIMEKIKEHDNRKFPLPENILENLKNKHQPLRLLIKDCDKLRKVRKMLVEQRSQSLDEFRQVLKPIRKWLWKMLPEGRSDKRLHDYGFKPYGK